MKNGFLGFIILLLAVAQMLFIGKAIKTGILHLRQGSFIIAIIERSKRPYEFAASIAALSLMALVTMAGGILAFFV